MAPRWAGSRAQGLRGGARLCVRSKCKTTRAAAFYAPRLDSSAPRATAVFPDGRMAGRLKGGAKEGQAVLHCADQRVILSGDPP